MTMNITKVSDINGSLDNYIGKYIILGIDDVNELPPYTICKIVPFITESPNVKNFKYILRNIHTLEDVYIKDSVCQITDSIICDDLPICMVRNVNDFIGAQCKFNAKVIINNTKGFSDGYITDYYLDEDGLIIFKLLSNSDTFEVSQTEMDYNIERIKYNTIDESDVDSNVSEEVITPPNDVVMPQSDGTDELLEFLREDMEIQNHQNRNDSIDPINRFKEIYETDGQDGITSKALRLRELINEIESILGSTIELRLFSEEYGVIDPSSLIIQKIKIETY